MQLNYNTVYGTFIQRPNRFIAYIDVDHQKLAVMSLIQEG